MYCPKCSQQVSDETRFCSRCGFQLNVVKALLANEAIPAGAESRRVSRSFSKRDISIGATLMFVAALIAAIVVYDLPPAHSARIIFLVFAWFLLTLLINIKPLFLYFLRGDSQPDGVDIPATRGLSSAGREPVLPSSRSVPVNVYLSPAAATGEMGPPASVTEGTTNLLKQKET